MSTELPLEVLGLMAPILSWAEGSRGLRLPEHWRDHPLEGEKRERYWMQSELPTFSHDGLEEITELARIPWTVDEPHDATTLRRLRGVQNEIMSPPHGYEIVEVFDRLGKRYFEWNGNDLGIVADNVEELHELSLRFPVRHLVQHRYVRALAAGVISFERAFELPYRLSDLHTTSRGLRAVVDHGLSEGHLHLYGVITADEAWCNQLLGNRSVTALRDFKPQDRRLVALGRAAVRLLALGVLQERIGHDVSTLPVGLIYGLDELYRASHRSVAHELLDTKSNIFGKVFRKMLDERVPREALDGNDLDWLLYLIDPASHHLRRRYRASPGRAPDLQLDGLRRRDNLLRRLLLNVQELLVRRTPDRAAETAADGQAAMGDDADLRDELMIFLQEIYFRYLIYHTHHWQLATQRGKTTGVRNFDEILWRKQRDLRMSRHEEQGLVFERLVKSRGLRQVEGRLSPPRRGPADLAPWILSHAKSREWNWGGLKKFGIIIHFKKARHRENLKRTSRIGHPILRYGSLRRTTRTRAFELYRLLSTPHPVVPFIVGIDAASLELTTPPEVFAPTFRFLRDYPIEPRRRSRVGERLSTYHEVADLVKNRRLGMTYHVGEDFRHLLSGLRAIREAVEFLHPRPGDRLGHALALALDPEVWATEIGYQAVLPKIEWLDTLVWVHHFLGSGHALIDQLAVEDQIHRLGRQIYEPCGVPGLHWSATNLYESWMLRQLDPYSIDVSALMEGTYRKMELTRPGPHHRRWSRVQNRIASELDKKVGSQRSYQLLGLYWFDESVQREGDKIYAVDMKRDRHLWLELCHEVQEKLMRIIENRKVVIEINPTSNRVIGPMPDLSQHPVFRLTLDEKQRLKRDIRVTVNSDDPGVFHTSLAHEYYLLAENLQRRGAPEAEVVEWLEWLRTNAEDYSFLRVLPTTDDPRMEKILQALESENRALIPWLQGLRRDYRERVLSSRLEGSKETRQIEWLQRKVHSLENQLTSVSEGLANMNKGQERDPIT